jgi:hypothetical protein
MFPVLSEGRKAYSAIMGRTILSFRIALAMEEREEWKPFRNVLDRLDRKKFLMRCRHT